MNWLRKGMMIGLAVIFIITGCSSTQTSNESEPQEESQEVKILKVSSAGNPGSPDPHFTRTLFDLQVAQPVFNGLVRFTPGTASVNTIEGDLAEKWEMSEDGKTWTFHLRKGVQWHKGYGELTSADVKWSIERVMNPETGSPRRYSFRHIDRIETPDDYTVIFHLLKPNPSFILNLVADGTGGGLIVKKEVVEASGTDQWARLIGTGPFIFESFTPNEKIVLSKNPDYFRGEPKLDKIEYYIMPDPTSIELAMDKGNIHMAEGVADQLWINKRRTNEDIVVDIAGPWMFWGIYLNTLREPFNDINVRKAIAHAVDIKSYVESLGPDVGKMPSSVFSSSYFGHSTLAMYEYNPEKAKEYLKQSGYEDGLTLPTSIIPAYGYYVDKAVYIQEELRKVGIEMPIEKIEALSYIQQLSKNQHAVYPGFYTVKPHAGEVFYSFFYGPSSLGQPTTISNWTHYNKSDDLILQAEEETDPAKAQDLYGQIQQQILDEYVVIPFAEVPNVLVRRKEVDLGYELKDTMIYMYPKYETTDIK